jgi:hypothetical protein
MSAAFNMHANWRQEDARKILAACQRNNGTITPYARYRGFRSFIVSWPSDGCEGHLYVLRVRGLQRAKAISKMTGAQS